MSVIFTTALDFEKHLDANPFDWTARLIYADFLEETNDIQLADAQRFFASRHRASAPNNLIFAHHWMSRGFWKTNGYSSIIPDGIYQWLAVEKNNNTFITEGYPSRTAAERDFAQALAIHSGRRR